MNQPNKPMDPYPRGQKYTSSFGTLLFVALRLLDLPLQYGILGLGWGSSTLRLLGINVLNDAPPASTGIAILDNLELSPFRLGLLAMAVASSLKQIDWSVRTNQAEFGPKTSVPIAFVNTLCNTLNSFLAVTAFFSPAAQAPFPQPQLIVGTTLLVSGIFIEVTAETQRKFFKTKASNKGKCYTGGLWSVARHINYTGFTMWRAGYTMAAGGWIPGMIVGGLFVRDFGNRAVPIIDEYCSKRYGVQWEAFKRTTPYKMIPGVF